MGACCVQGKELQGEVEGILAMKQSWPSIMRTLYGDHKRYEETYFSAYKVTFSRSLVSAVNVINFVINIDRSYGLANGRAKDSTCEWTTQHFVCRCSDSGGHCHRGTKCNSSLWEGAVALLASVRTLTGGNMSSSKVLAGMLKTTAF